MYLLINKLENLMYINPLHGILSGKIPFTCLTNSQKSACVFGFFTIERIFWRDSAHFILFTLQKKSNKTHKFCALGMCVSQSTKEQKYTCVHIIYIVLLLLILNLKAINCICYLLETAREIHCALGKSRNKKKKKLTMKYIRGMAVVSIHAQNPCKRRRECGTSKLLLQHQQSTDHPSINNFCSVSVVRNFFGTRNLCDALQTGYPCNPFENHNVYLVTVN